jgi:hypothetical protein
LKQTNNLSLRNNYRSINLIFACIITGIFVYSAIYSHKKPSHPIPSIFTQITGSESPSSGLSRSFSAIIRYDVQAALKLNPYSIQIFLFFAFQLVFRILTFFLIKSNFSWINVYILTDITLSVISFLLVFRPLIIFTFELFKKFIVN